MAGTTILLNIKKGDEVVVYAYTGTWLADFAMNHYTHWVGLLLKVVFIFIANVWSIDKNNLSVDQNIRKQSISYFFQPSDEECDNFLKEACDAVDAGEQGPLVA